MVFYPKNPNDNFVHIKSRMKNKTTEIKSVFDGFFWMEEADILYAILLPLITKLAVKIGKEAVVGIGVQWGLVNDAVVAWARNFAAEEVTLITTATRRMVQDKVTDWIGSGEPLRELEKQLLPGFGKVRAKRIAVTEVTNAYAGGNLETWKASEVVDYKRWNTAGTDVCPICVGLDQQEVPLNAMFHSDYDSSSHERPPAHVNCILPGNEVLPIGKISAAAQSFYEGGCIEISLANGSRITVTENHPVLTDRGWIAAQFIDVFKDSIFTVDVERVASFVNPNNQQSPSMIQNIFAALEESIFCSTVRVPSSPEDFNGDGRNIHGDVNVISANRLLGDDFDVFADEKMRNIKLDYDSFGFRHLSSLGLFHLHEAGNRYASSRDVSSFDLVRPLSHGHTRPSNSAGAGTIAGINIGFNEALSKSPTINTYLARQFLFRFASDITLEKVVEIRNFDFSGHVYDLQCDDYGLYATNGIITHNCKCWIQPVVKEPL